jgi:UDP-N-acetylmuramate--alanine ligase
MVVDDYGHHPSEIRATLQAAKGGWGRRLLVIFQPHRYTRTLHLREEFLTAFHEADALFVMDIYAAGEEPIEGVDAEMLCRGIRQAGHRDASYVRDRSLVVEHVMRRLMPRDLVLTLGAGDVWKLGEELIDRLERGDWPADGSAG